MHHKYLVYPTIEKVVVKVKKDTDLKLVFSCYGHMLLLFLTKIVPLLLYLLILQCTTCKVTVAVHFFLFFFSGN